jgi:hypothetical protein
MWCAGSERDRKSGFRGRVGSRGRSMNARAMPAHAVHEADPVRFSHDAHHHHHPRTSMHMCH